MVDSLIRAIELVNAAVSVERDRRRVDHTTATAIVYAKVKAETGVDFDDTLTPETAARVVAMFDGLYP